MSVRGQQAKIPASAGVNAGAPSLMSGYAPATIVKPVKVSCWYRREAKKLFIAGAKAIEGNDPRKAETYFLRAHELDPNNRNYAVSAEIARQYVVTQVVQRAEKEKAQGDNLDSLAALREAMHLDPDSPLVTAYVNTLAADVPTKPQIMRRPNDAPAAPVELAPQRGTHTFHLRTDEPSLIRQVLSAYGIQATVDASVKGQRIHFDAVDVDFGEATKLVNLATNTFLVPLDPRQVIVVSDTLDNRNKYERQVVETIYFPGLTPSELNDMGNVVRGVFGLDHAVVRASQGTLTVRAPEPQVEALERVCMEMLVGRSELQLDVHMYEIDKTKATNIGVVLPGSATLFNVPSEVNSILTNNASLVKQLLATDPSLAGNYAAILAALIASGALTGTVFNNPFAVFGGGLTEMGLDLSGVNVNMLLNSSDSRSFDQLQVRVLDQEEAIIRSGERYPVMTSSYSSLVGRSSSTATIPQIQYQDLGLTLKLKPHCEGDDAVSLNLNLKLNSLAGSTINNIPVLNNREYAGVVSLRFGDSALVVSSMSKQDFLEITGIPGLSDIPGFQNATNRQDTTNSMELVIVITPHLIRLAHRRTAEPILLLPQH
jgi:type II secretory pathway component GspD/PulD (secretin)